MTAAAVGPREGYEARLARLGEERARASRRSRAISHARLATFLGAAACVVLGLRPPLSPLWLAAGAALALSFAALVVAHDRVIRGLDRIERRHKVVEQALARLDLAWDRMADPAPPPGPPRVAMADDLDLFGRASLFRLLGTVRTPPGRAALAEWLVTPARCAEIRARQEAVRELSSASELRETLEATALALGEAPDVGPFLEWVEGDPWLVGRRRALLWAARVLPGVTVAAFGLGLAGLLPLGLVVVPMAVSIVVAYARARPVHEIFGRAAARGERAAAYVELLRTLSEAELGAARIAAVKGRLVVDGLPAHRQMARFARIMELADLRYSGMFHLPVTALTLWDLHVLDLLERWKARNGGKVRGWLSALGEAEALAALATLAHDEPGFCFPEVGGDARAFEAESLGHPLIPSSRRVVNDVAVGPPGTFLLVTGSNMSGKTTLLRSVGLAAVLAQAGGPVPAARLRMPEVVLGTSVRVRDSLEEGVSFFMAEVKRIKAVVDLARETEAPDGPVLLYLLDEVLQGTNSAERQVAVAGVLRLLLERRAIGAASTHDLALAGLEALEGAARPVHFEERLEEGDDGARMTFDYRLRDGVATSTNALKLLEVVGVRLSGPGAGPRSS